MNSGYSIFTLGHSTRPIAEFLRLLQVHGVRQIADVRTIPKSRHNPQYAQPALSASLHEAGLGYQPLPRLGGLRHARPDSPNTGWRNLSFRGFADYMQTQAFAEGLAELEAFARAQPTAILCAEAVPWRCHRSLIGDALQARGWTVLDIISDRPAQPHRTTPFLRVVGGQLLYPVTESAGGRARIAPAVSSEIAGPGPRDSEPRTPAGERLSGRGKAQAERERRERGRGRVHERT